MRKKNNIKTNMSIKNKFVKSFKYRLISGIAAISFIVAAIIPALAQSSVSALGQVTSRSIELSSSSNASSNATTSYLVSFVPVTSANIGGIIVDFCSNDPIIGDSCTAPTGFSVGASPTFTGPSGIPGTWSAASQNSNRTFELSDATPQTPTGVGSTPITFTITNVQNPTTLGTFYARITTYDTQLHANSYTASPVSTGAIDAGGVALSTVQQITITSKVQEQITFCVYTAAFDAGTCNAATGTSVQLGNTNGVLSTTGPYVDISTKYDIQSNALHGVVINFTGATLTSGSNTIEASACSGASTTSCPGGASTNASSTAGSPQFGLCTWSAGGTTGNLTPASPYNDSNCSGTTQTAGTGSTGGNGTAKFAFNITNAASTYGDTLANAVAGNFAQGEIAFIGNISNTSIAGIYTTTLTFIATGTY